MAPGKFYVFFGTFRILGGRPRVEEPDQHDQDFAI